MVRDVDLLYDSIDPDDAALHVREPHEWEPLLEYAKKIVPKQDWLDSLKDFESEYVVLKKNMQHSLFILKKKPLLTAFLAWSKSNNVGPYMPDATRILLEKDIIPFKNSSGQLLLIQHTKREDLLNILDSIRCRRDFDIFEKEHLVSSFFEFIRWLFCTLHSYEFNVEDPDRIKTRDRALPHEVFMLLLRKLDKRSQLVAKLLYFGGSRTLDQVINLKIENVLFDKQAILFDGKQIHYPRHVFEDIITLIEGKKSGNVFFGRQNTPLNPATIFRNFKEAASELDLGDSFSPKTLTTNI